MNQCEDGITGHVLLMNLGSSWRSCSTLTIVFIRIGAAAGSGFLHRCFRKNNLSQLFAVGTHIFPMFSKSVTVSKRGWSCNPSAPPTFLQYRQTAHDIQQLRLSAADNTNHTSVLFHGIKCLLGSYLQRRARCDGAEAEQISWILSSSRILADDGDDGDDVFSL